MGTVTALPRSRALTVEDLDRMPDDGHRYELIGGALVVTPAPSVRHQRAVWRLAGWSTTPVPLASNCSALPSTSSWPTTRRSSPTCWSHARWTSPSTALIDLSLKKARYEHAGVASYWVFDPDELLLRAWDLTGDGAYVDVADVADVSGAETWTSVLPYAVTVVPSRLVD